MKKYVCAICGYIYDEAAGIPEKGIAPGTRWENLPDDWTCPLCGASKSEFKEQTAGETKQAVKTESIAQIKADKEELRELSFGELSALCSNLSKGCEKQYRTQEADLFAQLASYYGAKNAPADAKTFDDLFALIQKDLSEGYPQANAVVAKTTDRGALRALVWGEKVTMILSSLLNRYQNQKDALLRNTKVFVCEICGFVYIGDEPPEICPVCKVPSLKIRQIERGIG